MGGPSLYSLEARGPPPAQATRPGLSGARCSSFPASEVSSSASGGARMQEGMFSLLQMAKTSAAIQRLKAARNANGNALEVVEVEQDKKIVLRWD